MNSERTYTFNSEHTLDDIFYQLQRFIQKSLMVILLSGFLLMASIVYMFCNQWQRVYSTIMELTNYTSFNTIFPCRESNKTTSTCTSNHELEEQRKNRNTTEEIDAEGTKENDDSIHARNMEQVETIIGPKVSKVSSCEERFLMQTGYSACFNTKIEQPVNND